VTHPLTILAEDHFGGAFALGCAIACTLAPLLYAVPLWIVARRRGKSPKAGLISAAVLAVGFSLALVPYWLRFAVGDTTTGVVTGAEKLARSSQGSVTMFTITLDDGRAFDASVENEDRDLMREGQRVMVRQVPAIPGLEQLGDEATLNEATAIGSLIAWGLLAAVTIAFGRVDDEDGEDDEGDELT